MTLLTDKALTLFEMTKVLATSDMPVQNQDRLTKRISELADEISELAGQPEHVRPKAVR